MRGAIGYVSAQASRWMRGSQWHKRCQGLFPVRAGEAGKIAH